jgi:hypothetical protein
MDQVLDLAIRNGIELRGPIPTTAVPASTALRSMATLLRSLPHPHVAVRALTGHRR